MKIENVEVTFGLLNDERSFGFHVYVASASRKGQLAHGEVNPSACGNAQKTAAAIAMTAVKCGEYLVTKYGDVVDHRNLAEKAIQALGLETQRLAELSRDVPSKVKYVAARKDKLDDLQLQFLDVCQFRIKQGLPLGINEIMALTKMVEKLMAIENGSAS